MIDGASMGQWPTYDDNSLKGDIGVALVKLAVARRLRWVFREKPHADLGIDGEIEVCDPGGKSHGRLISVQIKCGSSYLRSVGEKGFRYRPKPQHLNYWLGYTTPVAIVLVDDETETCYWQRVTVENLTVMDGVTLLEVPRSQVLDATCLSQLQSMAEAAQEIDVVRQSFRTWLAESSLFTHTWNNVFQSPRDFHGFDLFFSDLPGRGCAAADVVLGRPHFGEVELGLINYYLHEAMRNHGLGFCDHVMLGLASSRVDQLERSRLPIPPEIHDAGITVEYIPLLYRAESSRKELVEIDSRGQSMDDDLDFLYLNPRNPRDVAANERRRRHNRLWGSL